MKRNGDIQSLKDVYRGWRILPWQVQVLERELMLTYNWDWFNYQVQGHVIEQNEDETFSKVEITSITPDGIVGTLGSYRCNVVDDPSKRVSFRGECGHDELVTIPQYTITELVHLEKSLITI